MNLTVLLADSAQVDKRNKVHALGIGWTHTIAPSPPMAVVVFVELDPSELPFNLGFHVEVRDSDGTLVTVPEAEGLRPVAVDAEVQGSRSEDSRVGEPLVVPLVVQFGPGTITEPGSYAVHATVTLERDGTAVEAVRAFLAREPSGTG